MAHLDTAQKVINAARILLQDTVPAYRYPDTAFIVAINDALYEARRLRGDLFMGTNFAITEIAAPSDNIVFEPMYRTALVYYVAGKVQLIDDETTQDSRATVFLNKFVAQLAINPS